MGIREISYLQAFCDYPEHLGDTQVKRSGEYHLIGPQQVICKDCWENIMTTEDLLIFLKVEHSVVKFFKIHHSLENSDELNGTT